MRTQRLLPIFCFAMLLPTIEAQAGNCDDKEDLRQKAECIHDTLAPDVITQLLRLAITTTQGRSANEPPTNDFLFIAEEAGEAARRVGARPLIELASSKDTVKAIFAARAIGAYLDAVEHGYSHNDRFDGKGDAAAFAKARKVLPGPCDRLAKHKDSMVQAEGKRCLTAISRDREAMRGLLSEPGGLQGIGPVKAVGAGSHPGGLRVNGSPGAAMPR